MQFEKREDQSERSQMCRMFPEFLTEMTKLEKLHKHKFVRHAAEQQARLKGVPISHRIKQIHDRHLTVDHIVPLFGVNKAGDHIVCGLNVPWNMRGETSKDNKRKSNLFVDSRDAIAVYLPHQLSKSA